ncbi:hypothetical protein ONZ45_g10697 [Pleurotus djamor]|nr:hypothetical protein ONZ45_g10697 [Pleurotus djamor]
MSASESGDMALIDGPPAALTPNGHPSPFHLAVEDLCLDQLPFFYPLVGLEHRLPAENHAFLDNFFTSRLSLGLKPWLSSPSSGTTGATPGVAIFMLCTFSLVAYLNAPPTFSQPQCSHQVQPANSCPLQKHCFNALQKLYIWPSIIQKYLNNASNHAPVELVNNEATDPLDALVTATERIQMQNTMDKTLANILLAALGVRLAMESFPIPDSWPELDDCNVPPEFVACFRRLKGAGVHAGPRLILLPLHLSLSLSPILLLVPKSYINKSVSRAWLFKMWLHLGCDRPQHLSRVERVIWTAIYDIARSPQALHSILTTMRNELKDLANTTISDEERNFFLQLQPIVIDSTSNVNLAASLNPPAAHPPAASQAPQPPTPPPLPQSIPSQSQSRPPHASPTSQATDPPSLPPTRSHPPPQSSSSSPSRPNSSPRTTAIPQSTEPPSSPSLTPSSPS